MLVSSIDGFSLRSFNFFLFFLNHIKSVSPKQTLKSSKKWRLIQERREVIKQRSDTGWILKPLYWQEWKGRREKFNLEILRYLNPIGAKIRSASRCVRWSQRWLVPILAANNHFVVRQIITASVLKLPAVKVEQRWAARPVRAHIIHNLTCIMSRFSWNIPKTKRALCLRRQATFARLKFVSHVTYKDETAELLLWKRKIGKKNHFPSCQSSPTGRAMTWRWVKKQADGDQMYNMEELPLPRPLSCESVCVHDGNWA